jgi:hypothetical protein
MAQNMKAVLSNRIFMEVSNELQSKIDEELTYAIPPRNPLDPPFIIKNMGIVRKGLVTLPIFQLMKLQMRKQDLILKKILMTFL